LDLRFRHRDVWSNPESAIVVEEKSRKADAEMKLLDFVIRVNIWEEASTESKANSGVNLSQLDGSI
jgi:hypothetical protein